MTTLREAAQQALEAMEKATRFMSDKDYRKLNESIDVLKAALADGANLSPTEPVAKVELMLTGGNAGLATRIVEIDDHLRERLRPGQLLYTAPPQQALTIERLRDALVASRIIPPAAVEDPDEYDDGVTLFRIEALHRRIT